MMSYSNLVFSLPVYALGAKAFFGARWKKRFLERRGQTTVWRTRHKSVFQRTRSQTICFSVTGTQASWHGEEKRSVWRTAGAIACCPAHWGQKHFLWRTRNKNRPSVWRIECKRMLAGSVQKHSAWRKMSLLWATRHAS